VTRVTAGERLRGAVVLVTGSSSGIGAASAVKLARSGARVIVHGTDAARVVELAGRIDAVPLTADLSQPAGADRLAEAALSVAGRVDVLVNNAGVGWAGRFADMSHADLSRLVAVNLVAPIRLTRALLPQMVSAGAGQLVFVTSIAGRVGVADEAVYAATKAGLDVFAESLRLELRGTGVGVGVLVPGAVRTAFFDRRGQPYDRRWPRLLPPQKVADALVQLIATGRAEWYVPRWLRLAVAVRGVLPGGYRRLAARAQPALGPCPWRVGRSQSRKRLRGPAGD
jgi:short-subunit dehydrogenase